MPPRFAQLFRVGTSISGFVPVGGNSARLMADSDAAIAAMVADIDAAEHSVHLLFYIWLPDGNGVKVAEALKRAVARGVTCRAMADALGSRLMINSVHWQAMTDAGVRLARALPISLSPVQPLRGRIDMRNHRKIVVIDNRITYCGSQNCADPEFRIKAKYAPWVDILLRFEGPIVRQQQQLFAGDWMAHVDEDISDLLRAPLPPAPGGLPGAGDRHRAHRALFGDAGDVRGADVHRPARADHLDPLLRARTSRCRPRSAPAPGAGWRRRVIFPARNSRRAGSCSAASRSYYGELLDSGVRRSSTTSAGSCTPRP